MKQRPTARDEERGSWGAIDDARADRLRHALAGRPIIVCFGAGVDSTAMLVALRRLGIQPDVITFADTGGEKPETMTHLDRMNVVLQSWGWPVVDMCWKKPLASTGYTDLYGNCLSNQTLPSLAFGMKSCSIKWKQIPQDQFIQGVKSGPNTADAHPLWKASQATGQRIVKLIGYDCGRADFRRSSKPPPADSHFDYLYPLQIIGWTREDCVAAIAADLGAHMVPLKSACFFCPASKKWEIYWLAAHHPELLERALLLERTALIGKHSRFSSVEFGAEWIDLVTGAESFPSSTTTVGLGRSFSWNHWAVVNGVVDRDFVVRRDAESVSRFMVEAEQGSRPDNAFDMRSQRADSLPLKSDIVAGEFN